MSPRRPTIAVGLPVFNGEAYLSRALESLLGQDFEDFELIVSDNASTDHTEDICREFLRRDGRIRYHRNDTNIGASANYNLVFKLADAEYFKWASHDDECHPALLRRCLEVFAEGSPRVVLAFSRAAIIDEFGHVTQNSPDTAGIFRRPHQRLASVRFNAQFAHPLWGLLRSDALARTRLMGYLEADHVLLAELALLGDLVEIPDVLYRLRRHTGSAMNVHRTAEALIAWHAPERAKTRGRLPLFVRAGLEYLKAVWHIPLPWTERLLCWAVVALVPCWRWFLSWSGPVRHRIGLHRAKPRPSDG